MDEEAKEEVPQAEPSEMAKAKALLDKDRQTRQTACAREMEEVLKKYDCRLVPNINISAN